MKFFLICITTLAACACASQPENNSWIPAHVQVAKRFNIPELLSVEDSSDLAIFDQLASVQNEEYLKKCLKLYCIERDVFSINESRILNYLLRTADSSLPVPEQKKIFIKLINLKDYDRLAEFVVMFPELLNHSVLSYGKSRLMDGKQIIERIMKVDEDFYRKVTGDTTEAFVQEVAGARIYERTLKSITKNFFTVCSILANIPDDLYFQKILNTTYKAQLRFFFDELLSKAEIFEDDVNMQRIYETICRLLDKIPGSFQYMEYYSMLNRIRFGKVSVGDVRDLDLTNLDKDMSFNIVNAAALSKNLDVFKVLYTTISPDYKNNILSANVFMSIMQVLPETKISDITEPMSLIGFLSKKYNIVKLVKGIEAQSMTVYLIAKSENVVNEGLPVNFEFSVIYPSRLALTNFYIQFICQETYHTTETLKIFLYELLSFKSDLKYLDPKRRDYKPIEASYKTLAIIAESPELCDLLREIGMKFELSFHNSAKLFDKPVPNLKGILEWYKPHSLLLMFTSFEQIRNFENFFRVSIEGNFLFEASHGIKHTLKDFVDYRVIFHYWLQGPRLDLLDKLSSKYDKDFKQFLEEEFPSEGTH